MVEWIFGQGSTLDFFEIPPGQRDHFGGDPCMAQVRVPVGSLPGDRHYFHASGESYLHALKKLLAA